jgi:predicted RNase H-like HicB family nuclease
MTRQLTAIIEKEGNMYVALCPEVDVASQGRSVNEARANLKEALELFFETASTEEIRERLHGEVKTGTLSSIIRQSGLARTEFECE